MNRVLALAAVFAIPSTGAGATAWLPPAILAPPVRGAQAPAVAGDDDGRAIAAWATPTGVMVTLRTPGGPWYSPVRIPGSGRGATGVTAAMAARGRAAVAWVERGRVRASLRPGRRRFATARTLSPAGQVATAPRIAFGRGCAPIVAWTAESAGGGSQVRVRCASGAGRFGATQAVSAAGARAFAPAVAAGPFGAVIAWRQDEGGTYQVRAAPRSVTGGIGTPEAISPVSTGVLVDPDLAMSATGETIASWTLARGSEVVAQAAIRSAAGSWGRAEDISRPAPQLRGAQVGIDREGNAIASWVRSGVVQAAARSAGQPWGPPRDLSDSAVTAGAPRLAMSGGGAALITWAAATGTSYVVQAALRPAGGDFIPPATISDPGRPAIAPRAAIGDDGIAPVAWQWTAPGADPAIAPSGVMAATGLAGSAGAGPALVVDLRARPSRVRPGQRIAITFGLSAPSRVRIAARRAGSDRESGAITLSGADGANLVTLEGAIGGASLGRGRWIISATPRGGTTRSLVLVVV